MRLNTAENQKAVNQKEINHKSGKATGYKTSAAFQSSMPSKGKEQWFSESTEFVSNDLPKLLRFAMMVIGIFLIGLCVACYRISLFGTDPFSCMNLGISAFLGMSFGSWQLICNALILLIVWFFAKNKIGWGTLVNMAGVGYMADFIVWLVLDFVGLTVNLPAQIFCLMMGTLFAGLGCALYMEADMGVAPYDAVAMIISERYGNKISFKTARIGSDFIVICIGIIFGLLANIQLPTIAGIGTLINAFCTGPFISFFRNQIHTCLSNTYSERNISSKNTGKPNQQPA